MATTIDRFVLEMDSQWDARARVRKGWRITRYSFGRLTMHHLRSGASKTGVVDDFGEINPGDSYLHAVYAFEHEEIVPFYK